MFSRKHLLLSLFVASSVMAQSPAAPAGPPPSSAPAVAPATGPVPDAPVRIAQATVSSVKPMLTNRHILGIHGIVGQMPRGGFQWKATTAFRAEGENKGLVQITLVGTADAATPIIRGAPADFKFNTQVEVAELKGKRGEFEVVVVDGTGAELFRGTVKT